MVGSELSNPGLHCIADAFGFCVAGVPGSPRAGSGSDPAEPPQAQPALSPYHRHLLFNLRIIICCVRSHFFPCSVYICQATLISYKTEIIVTIIIIKTLVCSMVSAIRHHRAALGHLAFS